MIDGRSNGQRERRSGFAAMALHWLPLLLAATFDVVAVEGLLPPNLVPLLRIALLYLRFRWGMLSLVVGYFLPLTVPVGISCLLLETLKVSQSSCHFRLALVLCCELMRSTEYELGQQRTSGTW